MSDDTTALAATELASIERGWAEHGLPPDLLARAREANISILQLGNMLRWNAPVEHIEQEIRWAQLLNNGSMRFRQLTVRDNEAFCGLWANSPEEIGEWDVTAERGPNGFAQFELQERPTLNALFDGTLMVACVSFALRTTLVGGRRIAVRYGQAMRVHRDHRRHGYGNWVRSLPWAIGINRPTQIQYDYIRAQNMTMKQWNQKNMPNVASVPVRDDEVPGIPVTVQRYPAVARAGDADGIRPARVDDIESCAALINRTHAGRDLFRPYTPEFFMDRLDAGYIDVGRIGPKQAFGLDDFWIVERGGAIVACAGLWDRGRDLRERWRHRETGEEQVIAVTALLDFGFAPGHEGALADLVEHFIGRTAELGRDYLVAPLETLPDIEARLARNNPSPETRYMQWRGDTPAITAPAHLDLVYW